MKFGAKCLKILANMREQVTDKLYNPKPDKLPSQTTSYRPICLLSAIMKLFERVNVKRLRKHAPGRQQFL